MTKEGKSCAIDERRNLRKERGKKGKKCDGGYQRRTRFIISIVVLSSLDKSDKSLNPGFLTASTHHGPSCRK